MDDHRGFRAWARALLEAEGYRVIGEAADGAEAISAVGRLRPDILLLDVHLPDLDGFQVARRVAEQPKAPEVVLISSRERVEFGRRVAESGVRGFISKVELSGQTLQAVLSGGS
ncbi:MAG: response regulator [Acidimicrobiia bacterium]